MSDTCVEKEVVSGLEQIFSARVERAAGMLKSSRAVSGRLEFSSTDLLGQEKLREVHDRFPRKKPATCYLYHLSVADGKEGLAAPIRSAFRTEKSKLIRNLSRDNEKHQASSSIYVGTSKSLYDRFRTHLGKGEGKATWALYLSKWAAPLNLTFVLEYHELKDAIEEDVELIEGVLWDSLRPLFGKKGGK